MKIGAWEIRGGDRVTIVDRFGKERTGTANPLLLYPTHAVLNMGGKYGTPAIANDRNIARVTRRA